MEHLPVDAHAKKIGRIYADAELRLRALVAEALDSGALGTARYRNAQLAAVRQLLSDLQDKVVPAATEAIAASYGLGAHASATAGDVALAAFAGVHVEAIDVLADGMVNRLNDAASKVGRQIEDVYRKEGLRAAAQGLATGSTRIEASAAMADALTKSGTRAFIDRAGREWGLEHYSKMVVRTTTREAVSQGTANQLREMGNDLVTISSHDHEEDECSEYDGETFSLDGLTEGYPILDQLPPFHPNCVHVLTPAELDLDEFEGAIENAGTFDELLAVVGG